MTRLEKKIVARMKRIARNKPETCQPTLKFAEDWAYGNAGLENDTITQAQAKRVIRRVFRRATV